MNHSLIPVCDNFTSLVATLRNLATLPELAPFHVIENSIELGMIQLFPNGYKRPGGYRDIAEPLAIALGGTWEARPDGSWQSVNVTFPGLTKMKVVLHYIEQDSPCRPVDLPKPAVPATVAQTPEVVDLHDSCEELNDQPVEAEAVHA